MTEPATADQENLLAGTVHGPLRDLLRPPVFAIADRLLGMRVIDEQNVPAEGPLLVVANHLSNADPPLLELAFPRPLFFMGKRELFQHPALACVMRRFGAFPVDRGTPDRAALRYAERVLRQGIAMGIFPEGGRSKTMAMTPAYPGVGLLARQSQAPILPVAIWGTEFYPVNGDWPPRRPKDTPRGVTIRFGQPFTLPDRVDDRRVTAAEATYVIMQRIAELLPEQYHGVYADDRRVREPR